MALRDTFLIKEAKLSNEEMTRRMGKDEFTRWVLERIKERMDRPSSADGQVFSLGEWIDGLEQSGILDYLADD